MRITRVSLLAGNIIRRNSPFVRMMRRDIVSWNQSPRCFDMKMLASENNFNSPLSLWLSTIHGMCRWWPQHDLIVYVKTNNRVATVGNSSSIVWNWYYVQSQAFIRLFLSIILISISLIANVIIDRFRAWVSVGFDDVWTKTVGRLEKFMRFQSKWKWIHIIKRLYFYLNAAPIPFSVIVHYNGHTL